MEADNSGASQLAGAGNPADSLMQAIRTLGRLPKETSTATKDERALFFVLSCSAGAARAAAIHNIIQTDTDTDATAAADTVAGTDTDIDNDTDADTDTDHHQGTVSRTRRATPCA